MTIADISLVTIAGALSLLVLFLIGVLTAALRAISLIKREMHSLSTKGKSTIAGIKHLTTGSLNFLAQVSGKGGKRSKRDEKVMNWLSIGMGLYSLASKYFGKTKKKKRTK